MNLPPFGTNWFPSCCSSKKATVPAVWVPFFPILPSSTYILQSQPFAPLLFTQLPLARSRVYRYATSPAMYAAPNSVHFVGTLSTPPVFRAFQLAWRGLFLSLWRRAISFSFGFFSLLRSWRVMYPSPFLAPFITANQFMSSPYINTFTHSSFLGFSAPPG